MSSILGHIWANGLLPEPGLQMVTGEKVRIIAPGERSTENPNLFKNTRLEIDGETLCGNVVLHDGTYEREADLSNSDESEETTTLHVYLNSAHAKPGYHARAMHVTCPKELVRKFYDTIGQNKKFPCCSTIAELPGTDFHSTLSGLLAERLENKKEIIERIFRQCDQRWDDTLLKTAIRSFGFGIQSEVFDKWACLLNTNALGKHSDNLTHIEAIFFGQAGLLNDESIPWYYRNEATRNAYYNELKREYNFLRNKFNLESIDYRMWGGGNSTPHLRIARLAMLYYLKRLTVSGITGAQTLTDLYKLFNHSLAGYWQNHTCFGGTETHGNGCMRQKQVDVIIINSVVPMLYIYGKHRRDEKLCEKAVDLLHRMDSEENSIIKRWREQGVAAGCAADSQALLHLHRSYCRAGNCIGCRFALHYIKSRLKQDCTTRT